MKTFVYTLIIMTVLALSSVALADTKTRVITGRVLELNDEHIIVESGKKRLEIVTPHATKYTGTPKIGDTVTVHYDADEYHARFDPDGYATKIEVKRAKSSNE